MMRQILAVLAAAVALLGCDNLIPGKSNTFPTLEVGPNGQVLVLDTNGVSALVAIKPSSVEAEGDYVRVSGVPATSPPSGLAGPLHVQVSNDFEKAASGKKIRVSIVARAPANTNFAIAYSTREVGNSGWKEFDASSDWKVYSFEYMVPPMKSGQGDYIGIIPDTSGGAGSLEIRGVAADVVGG